MGVIRMEFFPGFKWAVPMAFSDAVSLCRFEEGDILYDTKEAYEGEWGTASRKIDISLQVKWPPRVQSTKLDRFSGIFDSNWGSPVKIDLYRKLKVVDSIDTTQGRLYTALWRGDTAVFKKTTGEPKIPLSMKDVIKSMEEVAEVARKLAKGLPTFVMPQDGSNSISREKFSQVSAALKGHLVNKPTLLSPEKAGFSQHKRIAPTIQVAFFHVDSIDEEKLHELVKKAVYVPTKNAKRQMFRMSAHGIII